MAGSTTKTNGLTVPVFHVYATGHLPPHTNSILDEYHEEESLPKIKAGYDSRKKEKLFKQKSRYAQHCWEITAKKSSRTANQPDTQDLSRLRMKKGL